MSSTDEVADLRNALARALERIEALEAASTPPAPPPSRPDVAEPAAGAVGRRSLLTKGLAAAGAVTAGAVLLNGQPAAAAGDPLILGDDNTSDVLTILRGELYVETPRQTGTAVLATTPQGYGIQTFSDAGVGINAEAPFPVRAKATSTVTTAAAVQATNATGVGVQATAATYGLKAESTAGAEDAGVGVWGIASNGVGVLGSGATAVRASGAGGVLVSATEYHLRLTSGSPRGAPTSDTIPHRRGDLVATFPGDLWLCVTAGTPGTWRKLGGPAAAGAFHVLPTPARVYDSRPGLAPSVGPKAPFAANETRPFDLMANGSGVPAGATAAMVTLLLVNAAAGSGNMTVWANGVAKPLANSLVWGGTAGRFTATAVTSLDAQARVQVNASARTDLVIDVVGYYR